ncbi:MAG: sulfotransferase domain-containing protein [Roseovarius indicus]
MACWLPDSILIGFPRSGTNFLQSVVQASTNRSAKSIYGGRPERTRTAISLKSHAPSPDILNRELTKLIKPGFKTQKIIRLFRDPRDVMISYFEMFRKHTGERPAQTEFLDQLFFSAFNEGARKAQSPRNLKTLKIVSAHRLSVRNWIDFQDPEVRTLRLHYEDMVQNPLETFSQVLDFLGSNDPVAQDSLKTLVSQVSQSDRPRAAVQGWKSDTAQSRYGPLISEVERRLGNEIAMLGY